MATGDRKFDSEAAADFSATIRQARAEVDSGAMEMLRTGVLSNVPAFGLFDAAQNKQTEYSTSLNTVATDIAALLDNLDALAEAVDEAIVAEDEAEDLNTRDTTNISSALEG